MGSRAEVRSRQNQSVSISEIVSLDAVALSRAIKSKQVSCVEVMTAYLDHIERLNPRVNAIVSLQPRADLLEQAETRDAQLARGEHLGWMHGFPHAVKDLEPTKGIRTTMGSPLFKDFVPREDSIMVERIRRAGAIIIGKTNVPEFGLGSQTYNSVFGTTLNAYDQSKTCGGSSGGAAVALALKMVPVADGSDNGGSLRNPAAWNNVFGFRTSFGRVPSLFNEVFMPPISVNGPMARTVPDLAMLLSVIAGYDPRTPLSIRQDPAEFAGPLVRDFKGTRIGWAGDFGGRIPFDPGVLELCAEHAEGVRVARMHRGNGDTRLPNRAGMEQLVQDSSVADCGRCTAFAYRRSRQARADETGAAVGNRKRAQDRGVRYRRREYRAHGVVSGGARVLREVRFHDRARRPGVSVRRLDSLAERSRRRRDGYLPSLDASDDSDLDVRLPRAQRPRRLQHKRLANGHPDRRPEPRRNGLPATRTRLRSSNQLGNEAPAANTQ